MEKRQKKPKTKLLIFLIIAVLTVISLAWFLIVEFMPTYDYLPLYEYGEGLNEDGIYIYVEDNLIDMEHPPLYSDETLYIPVDFVKQHMDERLFWDDKYDMVTLTTYNSVTKFFADKPVYYINNVEKSMDKVVKNFNGTLYMPSELLESYYNFEIFYDKTSKLIKIHDKALGKEVYITDSEKTFLRYEPDKKSPYVEVLPEKSLVTVFFSDSDSEYTKVQANSGNIGYVLNRDIVFAETVAPVIPAEPERFQKYNGKLTVVWDLIGNAAANTNESKRQPINGLRVLCPTWFSFDEEKLNGDIISIADREYTAWANENGYDVWGLITDNFKSVVSSAVLSDSKNREHAINQLLSFVDTYGLDGINIDFENVKKDNADYYIQFIRELAPLLREKDAVLSVDMYVPASFNLYYNRTEVAKSADYIIIMGYDEHHATSEISGPVASINFVDKGIFETLQEAAKEQVILGLPFYSRVWREIRDNDGNVTDVSSKSYGMNKTYNLFTENGVNFTWEDSTKSYYGEYTAVEDGETVYYFTWLEDLRSIEEKMKLVKLYDIAGVSGWYRGLEFEETWNIINDYLKE